MLPPPPLSTRPPHFKTHPSALSPLSRQLHAAGITPGHAYTATSATDARASVDALQAALGDDPGARTAFLASFEAAVLGGDPAALRSALAPMTSPPCATTPGGGGPATQAAGDSFVRVLLSTPCLQADVAAGLLGTLPALEGGEGGGGEQHHQQHLQRLVLSQFRWLDVVHDPARLTSGLLGALDACGPDLARDVVSFLPEVAPEAEHAAVVARLEDLAGADCALLLPALDAAAALPLAPALADRMHALALGRLSSVGVGDLPAVVQFVLQHAGGGGHGGAAAASSADAAAAVRADVAAVRGLLPFAAPADPRLPGIGRGGGGGGGGDAAAAATAAGARQRGKAASASASDGPGPRTVAAVGRALALAPAAGAAWLKEVRSAGAPADLTPLDGWALLHLRGGGGGGEVGAAGSAAKAVDAALRRGLEGGAMDEAWLVGAVTGHAPVLVGGGTGGGGRGGDHGRGLVDQALGAAASLLASSSTGGGPGPSAGGALYEALFTELPSPDVRQDVLRALLAHAGAGAGAPSEADAAMGVLARLAATSPADLAPYAAYVTGLLDALDAFTPAQAASVFGVLASLAVQGRDGRQGGGGGGGSGGGEAAGGARVEDELRIVLSKLAASPLAPARALATVGTATYFRRLADAAGGAEEAGDAGAAARWEGEAAALLRAALGGRSGRGAGGARLLDELAAGAGPAATYTRRLDAFLRTEAEALLCGLAVDLEDGGVLAGAAAAGALPGPGGPAAAAHTHTPIPGAAWLSLDAAAAPVALAFLPAAAVPGRAGALALAPAALRLFAAVADRRDGGGGGGLEPVSAMLGAPLALPLPPSLEPGALAAAPPPARLACARSLLGATNWVRALLSAFGSAAAGAEAAGGNATAAHKLAARAAAAAQLQAALPAALASCAGFREATFPTLHGDDRSFAALDACLGSGGKKGGGGGGPASKRKAPAENTAPNGQQAAAAAAASLEPPSAHAAVAAALLRPLDPAAFPAILGVLADRARPHAAALPAAAWVLGELAGGLGGAVGSLGPRRRVVAPLPGGGGSTRGAATSGPTSVATPPGCLQASPPTVLAAAVAALPAIGRLLRAAAAHLASGQQDGSGAAGGGGGLTPFIPTVDGSSIAPSPDHIVVGLVAAEDALSCTRAAAVGVARAALDCFRLVLAAAPLLPLASSVPATAAALAAIRGRPAPPALAPPPRSGDAGDAAVSLALVRLGALVGGGGAAAAAAATAAVGPEPAGGRGSGSTLTNDGAPGHQGGVAASEDASSALEAALADTVGADFSVHLARVRLLAALADWAARAAAAEGLGGLTASPADLPPPGVATARAALAAGARAMLAVTWDACPAPGLAPAVAARPGAGWRGRAGPLRDLVGSMVGGAPRPAAAAAALATGPLARFADGGPPGGAAASPGPSFPSLTPSTLTTWYGAVFDAFLGAWTPAAAAAGSAGREAERARSAPPDFEAHAAFATEAAGAYHALLGLTRSYQRAGALHAVALRATARFLGGGGSGGSGGLSGAMPLWRAAAVANPALGLAAFDAFARRLQQGTRIAQALCGEGKARRDAALVSAIPAAKRAMERFLVDSRALCRAVERGGAPAVGGAGAAPPAAAGDLFYVGCLKPRDLQGQVISSQAGYEEEEEDAEDAETETDEEQGAAAVVLAAARAGPGSEGEEAEADEDGAAPPAPSSSDDDDGEEGDEGAAPAAPAARLAKRRAVVESDGGESEDCDGDGDGSE